MAAHLVTPFIVSARRRGARDKTLLPLSTACAPANADILTKLESHLAATKIDGTAVTPKTLTIGGVKRNGDFLHFIVNYDVLGEREAVREADKVVFIKRSDHVSRFLAICTLWRPLDSTEGLLLVHNPWGRGNRGGPAKLAQRALTDADTKVQLIVEMLVPPKAVKAMLRNTTGRARYTAPAGIVSSFGDDDPTSAPGTIEFRLSGPLAKAMMNRVEKNLDKADAVEKLLTVSVQMPGADSDSVDVRFEDLEVEVKTETGPKFYSVLDGSIPSFGFNLTTELNPIYMALDAADDTKWAGELLEACSAMMEAQVVEALSLR